ncbi:MAG: hypothetical protein GX620_10290 [Chloroflexi bacterium]|nr:hypothetical protein [Chloroflexota bacterium]
MPRRRVVGTERYNDCSVDDAAAFLADFQQGGTGVFEVSRLVPGRGAGQADYQYVEVNGSKGTALYELQDPLQLRLGLREPFDEQRMITVPVPRRFFKVPGSLRDVGVDPPVIGFRYDQAFSFVQAIGGQKSPHLADFDDGWQCQMVLDAVAVATQERRWVDVRE